MHTADGVLCVTDTSGNDNPTGSLLFLFFAARSMIGRRPKKEIRARRTGTEEWNSRNGRNLTVFVLPNFLVKTCFSLCSSPFGTRLPADFYFHRWYVLFLDHSRSTHCYEPTMLTPFFLLLDRSFATNVSDKVQPATSRQKSIFGAFAECLVPIKRQSRGRTEGI